MPNDESDLYIYGIQDGALGSINIYDPDGKLVESDNLLSSDRPAIIGAAKKGKWRIEISPNPKAKQYKQNVNVRFNISAIPTLTELSLPEVTNKQVLSTSKKINRGQTIKNKKNNSKMANGKITLKEGVNVIENKSEYGYGEVKTYEINYDTTAPVISVWGMTGDEIMVANSEVVLKGAVDEGATVYINEMTAELSFSCEGGLPFSKKLSLQRGINAIRIKAIDNAGNIGTKEIRIIYE